MNPSLLNEFTETRCPDWVCPDCHASSLAIKKNTFHNEVIPKSLARWKEIDGELEDICLVFSCLLQCERAHCQSVVAVSGTGRVEETPWQLQEEGEEPHYHLFRATSFVPPLPAFCIPPRCPDPVRLALMRSFELFLSAPGAAANAIRIALEELMTALNVEIKGSLHNKIEALSGEHETHGKALMAIKWLGNVGSHELDSVTAEDVEHAYTIIEFVLRKIYAGSTATIAQLIERLAERYGPPKKEPEQQ